jgi:sugar O-acyltransferase (sialic acid O-acetyltransferase NeuD family)
VPERLVIFGAGTLAGLARAYFERDSDHEVVAHTVTREHLGKGELDGLPCVAFEDLTQSHPPGEFSLFVAVGYTRVNRNRAELFERCLALGYELPTLVSSRAQCWDDLAIGRNCLVFDGVVIEPRVHVGDDVVVWSGAQISHDSSIGDHCFLAPHAVVLGDVSIGPRSFVGGNATVRNGISIAADCVLGAGSVVKRDTAPGEVLAAKATPARAGTTSADLFDL